jgi:glucose/arabinose dehydrogenase
MLISLASLALLALFASIGCVSLLLLRRSRISRLLGVVLVVEALLALGAQIALSTIPFGIGEPLIRVKLRDTLVQAGCSLLVILGAAALVYWGGRLLSQKSLFQRRRGIGSAALLLAVPLLGGASMYGLSRASLPERERERDPHKRTIKLPQGFAAGVYAQGTMDNPTTIAFGPKQELYIGDISGSLWVAPDADGDGKVDSIGRWADGFTLLLGLAWHSDELFVASAGKIEALRDTNGDGKADARRTVVQGLPSMVLMPHSNNGISFGPDGRLYFGVGSTTEGQVETNERAAAVLSVKPDGSDLKVFARGLGNTFAVAFNRDGELFGGDNSPQGEGDDPPDEFNHLVAGGHYGFPYFYGDPPENGGTRGALVTFPAHSAPTGTTFYTGNTFPRDYLDSGFVTLWARGEIARVEVGRAASGAYLGRTTTFGSGFLYPIGVTTGPDGNLYVADFGTSAIYRITYDPNKAY